MFHGAQVYLMVGGEVQSSERWLMKVGAGVGEERIKSAAH